MFPARPLLTLLVASIVGLGCGPSGGTTTETASTTNATATSEGVTTVADADEQMCLGRCLNQLEAAACGGGGEACYSQCISSLDFQDLDECYDLRIASWQCEAEVDGLDVGCESTECLDVYIAEDTCRGWCSHLGGFPGQGSSQTDCDWRSTCYGIQLEMVCPATDNPTCDCIIDDEVVATCALGDDLSPFNCGDHHVLSDCCADVFLEAIQS